MITNFDRVERRHRGTKSCVHRLDRFLALGSAADVGLIRNHHQKKAGRFQSRAFFGDIRIDFKIVDACRRKGKSVANERPVQHAIAIEKYGGPLLYFVLSHFVGAVLTAG